MNVGKNIRRIRESRQISRHELADALNLSYSSICKYECGNRTPDYDSLAKMARVFQVNIEELFGARPKGKDSSYSAGDLPGGNIHEKPDEYTQEEPTDVSELSDEESYIIMLYRGLDSTRKDAVRELLEPISSFKKPKSRSKGRKPKTTSS